MEHPDTALRLGDAPNGKSFMFFGVISISENHNPLVKCKTFCFNLVIRSEEMCSWFILCEEKGGMVPTFATEHHYCKTGDMSRLRQR